MPRQPFNFDDIRQECRVELACHALHGNQGARLGARVHVPPALMGRYPYNGSAYGFLQQLRQEILALGVIEFPGLPVNRRNHTLAQRAPKQHAYSSNPYLTGECQHLHQDTPPYPTAFWLDAPRRFFGTWVTSLEGLRISLDWQRRNPAADLHAMHRALVPESLAQGYGVVLNRAAGLLLIDNSEHQQLYHARTCDFAAVLAQPDYAQDAPMYAFNEVGLLHYIDSLDSRRGTHDRDEAERAEVAAFMAAEPRF